MQKCDIIKKNPKGLSIGGIAWKRITREQKGSFAKQWRENRFPWELKHGKEKGSRLKMRLTKQKEKNAEIAYFSGREEKRGNSSFFLAINVEKCK
ncbi:MAG: hypothetical protein ACLU8F_02565 [Clostridia bacterium]